MSSSRRFPIPQANVQRVGEHQQEQVEDARFFSPEQRLGMSAPRKDIRHFGQPVHQDNPGSEQDVEQLTSSVRASTLNPVAHDFHPGSTSWQQHGAFTTAYVPYAQANVHSAATSGYHANPTRSAHIPTYITNQPYATVHQLPHVQAPYDPATGAGYYTIRAIPGYTYLANPVYTHPAMAPYMPTVDELRGMLDAQVFDYNDLLHRYHQVGLQYHSIPIRFRSGRPTHRIAEGFVAAFIVNRDDYDMSPEKPLKVIHGLVVCGRHIHVAFEALRRGDLQAAAHVMDWYVEQNLDLLAEAVRRLEVSIGDVVLAADRAGRGWVRWVGRRKKGWEAEMMRKDEMTVEARGKQAQWETALLEAGRYVKWVEDLMDAEEEDAEETYEEEMFAEELDAEVIAVPTPVAKKKRKGRGKGKGKGKARPVEQTAGPFVLDAQGQPIKGHATYQLRKSMRKRLRKEEEEKARLAALDSSEGHQDVEDDSDAVEHSAV